MTIKWPSRAGWRQILGVAVTVYGVLTASVAALHLPVAISTILVAFGPALFTVQHAVDGVTATMAKHRVVVVSPAISVSGTSAEEIQTAVKDALAQAAANVKAP